MIENQDFLQACFRQPVNRVPVWYLNQYGRHLPLYQEYRSRYGLDVLYREPEIMAQLTIAPVDYYGVDAAILFTDLLPVLEGMGLKIAFVDGNPVVQNPIQNHADIDSLVLPELKETVVGIFSAIQQSKKGLQNRVPLIGFAGSPFTLACYALEGRVSSRFLQVKRLLYQEPQWWHRLMEKITTNVAEFICEQARVGAQAIELFDSFVGILSPFDFREYVFPHLQRLVTTFQQRLPDIPLIYYSQGSSSLIPLISELNFHVLHVDWRVELARVAKLRDQTVVLQGNLDPALLLGNDKVLFYQVNRILDVMGNRPGYIFNVGHLLYGETDPQRIRVLTDFIHQYRIS